MNDIAGKSHKLYNIDLSNLKWPPASGKLERGIVYLDPPRIERTRMEIRIKQTTNGWIVYAGCYDLVFEDATKLAVELTRYLANPEAVTSEYTKKYRRGVSEVSAAGYSSEDSAIPGPTMGLDPAYLRRP